MKAGTQFKTVAQYLAAAPEPARAKLKEIRTIVQKAAPDAEEVISYNMPAYKLDGVLVYYAGYNGHIGFYPTASGIEVFKDQLSNYEVSKGTIRFPLDKPLPAALITKIVKFKVKENKEKASIRAMKKRS